MANALYLREVGVVLGWSRDRLATWYNDHYQLICYIMVHGLDSSNPTLDPMLDSDTLYKVSL